MTDSTDPEDRFAKLRRAAFWALLGAGSGLAAWGVVWAVVWASDQEELAVYTVPGPIFGLVIGSALYRLGHARVWQVELFALVSAVAWYAGFTVGLRLVWNWSYPYYGAAASVGGLVWCTILTAGVAILFPFTRRLVLWVVLLLASSVTAGLVIEALLTRSGAFLLILWVCCYAVYAAILSTALPSPKLPSPKPALTEAGV